MMEERTAGEHGFADWFHVYRVEPVVASAGFHVASTCCIAINVSLSTSTMKLRLLHPDHSP
jgi:hypothetical protein